MTSKTEQTLKKRNATLEKELAAKNRELEIETALEKVRARTMAMQHSDELAETSFVLFQQFKELGKTSDQISIGIFNEEENIMELYSTLHGSQWKEAAKVELSEPVVMKKIHAAWKKKKHSLIIDLEGDQLKKYNTYRKKLSNLTYKEKRWVIQVAFFSKGVITFSTTEPQPKEIIQLLERFAVVFDGTYTRFLDLQKAEAQAREAQIELGLERVRASAMAMRQSNELAETALLLFQQLLGLGLSFSRTGFYIWQKDADLVEGWASNGALDGILPSLLLPFKEDKGHRGIYEASLKGELTYEQVLSGEELEKHYQWLMSQPTAPKTLRKVNESEYDLMQTQYKYAAIFKGGYLLVIALKPQPDAKDLLIRFAKVFQQTYTRFLDLQKAEAQGREAQIEAALEKVRSHSLAMHKSDELNDVVKVVFEKLQELQIPVTAAGITIYIEGSKDMNMYVCGDIGNGLTINNYLLPYFDHPIANDLYDVHEKGLDFFVGNYSKEEKDSFYKYAFEHSALKVLPDEIKNMIMQSPSYSIAMAPAKHSMINLNDFEGKSLSENETDVLKRFSKVFEQTYTRFLDLQKSEAQSRENQIQLALERARTQSMIMQHSSELDDTLRVFHEQVLLLGINSAFSFLWLPDEEKDKHIFWADWAENNSTVFKSKAINYPLDRNEPATAQCLIDWKSNDPVVSYHVPPEGVVNYFASWSELIAGVEDLKPENFSDGLYYVEAFMKYGCFGVMVKSELQDDEKKILYRFSVEFEQTYTRFLDLQKAEAQTREAKIEAALERIRARSMAMHKSEALVDVVRLLNKEIIGLGIEIHSSIIVTDFTNTEEEGVNDWLAVEGQDFLEKFHIPYLEHPITKRLYNALNENVDFYTENYSKAEKNKYYRLLFKYSDFRKTPKERQEFIYNLPALIRAVVVSKNSILVFQRYDLKEFTKEEEGIFKRFGKVFEQAYTRFLDLQKAEAQAREAEIELALERVRARTMAMQKSEELKEVIQVVYDQFVHLNINVEHTGFILDYKERDDMFIWLADKHEVPSQVTIPYFDSSHWNSFIDAKSTGKNFFPTLLSFEEKNKFYKDLFKLFPVPDEAKEYYFSCPGLAGSTVLLDNISLYIENFEGIPFTDEENDTLMRLGKVFQQTYTRFLDLQKAEAQAKESQIQLALERVRARTMAMQKSGELQDAAILLFQQMKALGVQTGSCGFNIWNKDEKAATVWMSSAEGGLQAPFKMPHTESAIYKNVYAAMKNGEELLMKEVGGKALKKHFDYLSTLPGIGDVIKHLRETGYSFPETMVYHFAFFNNGYLSFHLHEHSTEAPDIFKRFAKVFNQTYTRFLDLQKAEAQAREAEIQLALERVRARTMAMQHSDELAETSELLFQQINELGIHPWSCGFNLWYEDDTYFKGYNPGPDGKIGTPLRIPLTEDVFFKTIWEAKHQGEEFFVFESEGESLAATYHYMDTLPVVGDFMRAIVNSGYELPKYQVTHCGFFPQGHLMFITLEPHPEDWGIFKRFTKEFEQTYTRFLDLQKAEAQARESQIQLALERVRARTMAMQKQDDLLWVLDLLVEQLVKLGVNLQVANFSNGLPGGDWDLWIEVVADPNTIFNNYVHFPRIDHPYFHHVEKNIETYRKDGTDLFKDVFSKEEKDSWQDYINTQTIYKDLTSEEIKQSMYEKPGYSWSMVILKDTWVSICRFNTIPFSVEEDALLRRFANAFGQTYTRFLDLQKAEAQAREAQIESALERVRSRTMAMQNSDELADLVATVFNELNRLEFALTSCIIWINNPELLTAEMWVASTEMNKPPEPYYIKPFRHPYFKSVLDAWKQKNKKWVYEMNVEEKKNFQLQFFNEVGNFPTLMKNALKAPESVVYSASFYNFGALEIIGTEPVTDEKFEILHRLGKVFDMSYTRFNDLKQAEAQAQEAKIETALERVRSRTMAMQKSDELAETSAILFRQLKHLGIAPNRLYIGVTNDKNTDIEFWITDEEGSKVSTMFSGDAAKNNSVMKMYEGWKQQKTSIVIDMHRKELDEYFHYLGDELRVPFQGGLSQKRRIQYISYFSKGFIGMASPDEQPEKTVLLLDRFAAVFNLTFTRFNDLKVAEAHAIQAEQDLIEIKTSRKKAEDALSELQSTQKQLIQSEKMASLGELTAGIAHEIQNPLNFVNNFSDVNKELLAEMKDEMDKGNTEDAKSIANDVIENEEKINHHGKRAGDIVKGMLQHSRSSTGVKEPTDINAMADEYLRLSYHGLRAKAKEFNATMKTNFDESIGKINIIAQDIGRVLLNLYNNAFYAVQQKQLELAGTGLPTFERLATLYQPTVSVTTKKTDNHVIITVSDNGNGIPKNIVDKIFQPFFTTKPTGSGTGLGLSLSYDIVKAHGGEIKVETLSAEAATQARKEEEGTEFIIQLPLA